MKRREERKQDGRQGHTEENGKMVDRGLGCRWGTRALDEGAGVSFLMARKIWKGERAKRA